MAIKKGRIKTSVHYAKVYKPPCEANVPPPTCFLLNDYKRVHPCFWHTVPQILKLDSLSTIRCSYRNRPHSRASPTRMLVSSTKKAMFSAGGLNIKWAQGVWIDMNFPPLFVHCSKSSESLA